jgi:hypothetical protein
MHPEKYGQEPVNCIELLVFLRAQPIALFTFHSRSKYRTDLFIFHVTGDPTSRKSYRLITPEFSI